MCIVQISEETVKSTALSLVKPVKDRIIEE